MANSRKTNGIGVFYHRDSGGEHQNTPRQYVKWAAREAAKLGVEFEGTPSDIELLIENGASYDKYIYLDYKIEGDRQSRPALDALIYRLENEIGEVTHLFIPTPID